MTTRAEIEAEFQGVRDLAVLKRLARLCDSFRVTPEELSAEWDIVELRTSRALSLDEAQVRAMSERERTLTESIRLGAIAKRKVARAMAGRERFESERAGGRKR